MALTAQGIYSETVRGLPPAERLRLAALILNELADSEASRSHDDAGKAAREDEIGKLYDEIAELTATSDGHPEVEGRLEATWARLRALQAQEAREFREAFEASLAMPLDAGARILAEARALRRQLEDLTSSDPAAEDTAPPTA